MVDLQHYKAKVCLTASGALIENGRIVLIKHKKLGVWLMPGGHIDPDELPHQAAEREFLEETGITVSAIQTGMKYESPESEYVPAPVSSNLHWVCKENYDLRKSGTSTTNSVWKKGCEQHLDLKFLMQAEDSSTLIQNTEETDGLAWFGENEIEDLETWDDIKAEIRFCFAAAASMTE